MLTSIGAPVKFSKYVRQEKLKDQSQTQIKMDAFQPLLSTLQNKYTKKIMPV